MKLLLGEQTHESSKCGLIDVDKTPLYKEHFLGEFRTPLEKKQARENLDIPDTFTPTWGSIEGFIEDQKDLIQLLQNLNTVILNEMTLYEETGLNTDGAMTQKAVTDELNSILKLIKSINNNIEGEAYARKYEYKFLIALINSNASNITVNAEAIEKNATAISENANTISDLVRTINKYTVVNYVGDGEFFEIPNTLAIVRALYNLKKWVLAKLRTENFDGYGTTTKTYVSNEIVSLKEIEPLFPYYLEKEVILSFSTELPEIINKSPRTDKSTDNTEDPDSSTEGGEEPGEDDGTSTGNTEDPNTSTGNEGDTSEGDLKATSKLTLRLGCTNGYSQAYVEITDSTVEVVGNEAILKLNENVNLKTYSTFTHGLNIADFLKVTLHITGEKASDTTVNAFLTIVTSSGYYTNTIEIPSEHYGYGYADCKFTGKNVRLSITSPDFSKPVWIFGDYYVNLQDNRWTSLLRDFGYFDVALFGFVDGDQASMYLELKRALNYGTPLCIIWAIGANNYDDFTITGFNTRLNSLYKLCKSYERDIDLILTTYPNTPNLNNEEKNELIKSFTKTNNLRYIDFAKALYAEEYVTVSDDNEVLYDASADDPNVVTNDYNVGEEINGVWYDGMMTYMKNGYGTFYVPTSMGAYAMVAQVLTDFPEIMRYTSDVNSTTSVVSASRVRAQIPSIEIVQTTGESTTAVMSQDAVSGYLEDLDSKIETKIGYDVRHYQARVIPATGMYAKINDVASTLQESINTLLATVNELQENVNSISDDLDDVITRVGNLESNT